jgi:flagellar motor switch protein FliM
MLGDAELELPKVMDLRVGDVLRLSARLHEPLTVSCEGRPFARALLGVADGRKAIQFTVEENPS